MSLFDKEVAAWSRAIRAGLTHWHRAILDLFTLGRSKIENHAKLMFIFLLVGLPSIAAIVVTIFGYLDPY